MIFGSEPDICTPNPLDDVSNNDLITSNTNVSRTSSHITTVNELNNILDDLDDFLKGDANTAVAQSSNPYLQSMSATGDGAVVSRRHVFERDAVPIGGTTVANRICNDTYFKHQYKLKICFYASVEV